jgi:hypothetical protein
MFSQTLFIMAVYGATSPKRGILPCCGRKIIIMPRCVNMLYYS